MNQQKADEGSVANMQEELTEYRGNQDDDVIVIHDDDSEDEEENVKVNKSREKTIDEHASIILRNLLNSSHFKRRHTIDETVLLAKLENTMATPIKEQPPSPEYPDIPEYTNDYDDDGDTVVNGEMNQSLEKSRKSKKQTPEQTFHKEETEQNFYQDRHYRYTPPTNNTVIATIQKNGHVKLITKRPFTCTACGTHTSTENAMLLHYHFHHWKKSGFAVAGGYLCPKCGIFCKSKYSLLGHMERIHPPAKIPRTTDFA